jgi:hypothetical protein
MPGNDGHIAVNPAARPGKAPKKGATMCGNRRKSDDGTPEDDGAPKAPPVPPPEDDEEDGDIATPKRDRDDEAP